MHPIGVLALQGGFAAHVRVLRALSAEAREIRRPAELAGLAGLVLPGGESTTMLRSMGESSWFDALRGFPGAVFGTCAGAILLARCVIPAQPSLGLLDVDVERNAYGRQVDSFAAALTAEPALGTEPVSGVFIRAPRFRCLGKDVRVLARHAAEPVLVQQGLVLAAAFHPELTDCRAVHRLFLEECAQAAPNRKAS